MSRSTVALALLLTALAAPLLAQTSGSTPQPAPTKAQAPDVLLGAVPELLYSQLPSLPKGYGIVVEELQPNGVLYQAGLRRFDIILEFTGTQVRDKNHFTHMLGKLETDEPLPLVVFRGGKRTTVALSAAKDLPPLRKGLVKMEGPPAVTVDAQPLQDGKLKVTFLYYSENSGKLESVTCSGSIGDIEREVRTLGGQKRMSPRVQDLVDVALKRIRTLNLPESR